MKPSTERLLMWHFSGIYPKEASDAGLSDWNT